MSTPDNSCNHLLGISVSKVRNKKTKEIMTSWNNYVYAEDVGWKAKDGIISLLWYDDGGLKFKFCPLCGFHIGELVPGLRAAQILETEVPTSTPP